MKVELFFVAVSIYKIMTCKNPRYVSSLSSTGKKPTASCYKFVQDLFILLLQCLQSLVKILISAQSWVPKISTLIFL